MGTFSRSVCQGTNDNQANICSTGAKPTNWSNSLYFKGMGLARRKGSDGFPRNCCILTYLFRGRQRSSIPASATTSGDGLIGWREEQLGILADPADCHSVMGQIPKHGAVGKATIYRYDQATTSVIQVKVLSKLRKSLCPDTAHPHGLLLYPVLL